MATHSPAYLAKALAKAAQAFPREVELSEDRTLNKAYQLAYKYSMGTVTAQELARNRPYAVRHGAPLRDPSIINQQSSHFIQDWETIGPYWRGGTLYSVLRNISQIANWLEFGTKFMFARPIVQRIINEITPVRKRNLDAAMKKIFRAFK